MSTQSPFTAHPSAAILGEIVSWDFSGATVAVDKLRHDLTECGFDAKKLVKDMLPRNAFARSIRDLTEARVIRKVGEDAAFIRFQFTKEANDGAKIDYNREAVVSLDKHTGKVRCSDRPDLEAKAQELVDTKTGVRYGKDLHAVVSDLFRAHADMFPIRSQGGCYFVPAEHLETSKRIALFVEAVRGNYRRFPIPVGYGAEKSAREAMQEGLEKILLEYSAVVEAFDPDNNTELILKNTAKRVGLAKLKIEAYANYLDAAKSGLIAQADAIQAKIVAKINGERPAKAEAA